MFKLKTLGFSTLLFILLQVNVLFATIDTVDNIAPVCYTKLFCGGFLVNVTEKSNSPDPSSDSTIQRDVGVYVEPSYAIQSNVGEIVLSNNFVKDSPNYDFFFTVNVLDITKSAYAKVIVFDNVRSADSEQQRNYIYLDLVYTPPSLQINPGPEVELKFGNKIVGSQTSSPVTIQGVNDTLIKVDSIYLKYGKVYSITDTQYGDSTVSLIKTMGLKIFYNPKQEYTVLGKPDYDTLIIKNCLTYKIPITGFGVIPRIDAYDFDFGLVRVGDTVAIDTLYYPDSTANGLKIYNGGTGELQLYGYTGPDPGSGFFINLFTPISTPIVNQTPFKFRKVYFTASEPGEYFGQINWSSNGQGYDSVSKLRAIAYLPGPYASSVYFGKALVKSKVTRNVLIRNSGDESVIIKGFKLGDQQSGDFIIDTANITPPVQDGGIELVPGSYLHGTKEIIVPVIFSPQSEFDKETKIYPVFGAGNEDLNDKIFNNLFGYGYLPKIAAKGYEWTPKILVNYTHADTGAVSISSVSSTADLHVISVDFVDDPLSNQKDFILLDQFPNDITIPRGVSRKFRVLFRPLAAGIRHVRVRIISNAVDGANRDITTDTTYVELTGTGYNRSISAVNPTFRPTLNCDTSSTDLIFTNSNPSVAAYVYDIRLVSGDTSAFQINKDTLINNADLQILPKRSMPFKVIFNPNKITASKYEAICRLYTSIDTTSAILGAETYLDTFLIRADTVENGQYGMLTKNIPGYFHHEYKISASYYDTTHPLTNISFDIVYNPAEIMYSGEIERGELISDWDEFNAVDASDGAYRRLHITASGNNTIRGYGILVLPVFQVLLSDNSTLNLKLENVVLGGLDSCADVIKSDGVIKISGCGSDLKHVIIGGDFYLSINNNIIENDADLNIDFSLAFDSPANLKIYNSSGNLVKKYDFAMLEHGLHSISFNSVELPNGMYFVHLLSDGYTDSKQFVISR